MPLIILDSGHIVHYKTVMTTAYEIAKRLGRDPTHLYKIKRGVRRPSPEYAKEIEEAAGGEEGWRVKDLRPDLAALFEPSSQK